MKLRLAEKFQKRIINYFSKKLPLQSGEKLFVFGSRVNLDARGGDIDLFLECSDPLRTKEIQKQRNQIKNDLVKIVDDQKVDLKISLVSEKDPFTESIRKKAVLLFEG